MKILLAGGGTGGPVMPLIAVQQKLKEQNNKADFLLIGTSGGPEKKFAEEYDLTFVSIPAGKLRRYFTWRNLAAPFEVLAGLIKALKIIRSFEPDLVFAAGGYVAVPVVYAAKLLGKKILIHQQDVLPSLTNKLIAPLADVVTVSFEKSINDFFSGSGLFGHNQKKQKIIWTGNPVRVDLLVSDKKRLAKVKSEMGLNDQQPILLVLGGATGALALNKIIEQALPELIKHVQVIHQTGRGKQINFKHENYHATDLIGNMNEVYALADLIISRAGLSTITELAALKKASIIVPMPRTHQYYNAHVLEASGAAVVLDQEQLNGDKLLSEIKKLLYDGEWQTELKANIGKLMPRNATEKIAKIITELCQDSQNARTNRIKR